MVRTEESRAGAPWLIAGETPVTVKVASADVAGRYSVLEVDTPPGIGPAMHVHTSQNELFLVLRGSIGIQCGGQRYVLKTGDSFLAPMGVPHAYVTLGSETARILNMFDPAGEMERFFREYAPMIRPHQPPDMKAIAALNEACGMHVVGPPLKASLFATG